MLTFLELYQTLLGFVFFKLYTDAGLVYPPPQDVEKDEAGAGVGAFHLQGATTSASSSAPKIKEVEINGKKVSTKDVRQTIKSISTSAPADADVDMPADDSAPMDEDEDFVPHPSTSNPDDAPALPTLKTLAALPQSGSSRLFAPYTFWLSRETSRPIFEFIVRSFGGRLGWPASSGSGSPFDESDESITHVIIDRPLIDRANMSEEEKERRRKRKYIQPQWVVDCINAGKPLLEEPYLQGKTLPPHLSPFGEHAGAYDPTIGLTNEDAVMEDEDEEEVVEDEDGGHQEVDGESDEEEALRPEEAALKAAATAEDEAALRAAELEAEAAGVDYGTFAKEAKKATKAKQNKAQGKADGDAEQEMNKMMMSNKQRKLYERMKYSERKRTAEVCGLVRFEERTGTYGCALAAKSGAEENSYREGEEEACQKLMALVVLVPSSVWFSNLALCTPLYSNTSSCTSATSKINIGIELKSHNDQGANNIAKCTVSSINNPFQRPSFRKFSPH